MSRYRTIERPEAKDRNVGPRFRARRVALNVSGVDLGIPRAVWTRLPWIEDGTEDPACGWTQMENALMDHLARIVGDHMWSGGAWEDLRLPGWSVREIMVAAASVMATAQGAT